ncbi:MAG: 2-amino-4-hydroxy-6-hydroxymethyldihydropteridine diphosphokinase [Bacteroidetes bacterium]|nr:2-amino-4-hydroxy-6-hydroxymethyldihydropteridine diphosphokinase [Bacteroidota bacterium]
MIDVFLLLGGNLGDRHAYLRQAAKFIENEVGAIVKQSSFYETQAWGKTDEPDYLNQVIQVSTALAPELLLEKILDIERLMGRKRDEKWGSRIIDIDILFYGSDIISAPGLTIPHPELHKRRFTLEPLSEIAPDFEHPVLHKTIVQLKSELNDDLHVKKL